MCGLDGPGFIKARAVALGLLGAGAARNRKSRFLFPPGRKRDNGSWWMRWPKTKSNPRSWKRRKVQFLTQHWKPCAASMIANDHTCPHIIRRQPGAVSDTRCLAYHRRPPDLVHINRLERHKPMARHGPSWPGAPGIRLQAAIPDHLRDAWGRTYPGTDSGSSVASRRVGGRACTISVIVSRCKHC